jgi:hypothetical protein
MSYNNKIWWEYYASFFRNRAERMGTMTKEEFLTVRWNNILSVGLGIPALVFVAFAFLTSLWLEKSGLIWLSIIGVIY